MMKREEMSGSTPIRTEPATPTVADVLSREGNSIGFLRLFFATAVILHHSFTLRHGVEFDPLGRLTGQLDIGSLAVGAFLMLSGFLISASYEKSATLGEYFWHRALRLYPGFLVCLLISVGIIGPAAWKIAHGDLNGSWSAEPRPLRYLWSNSTLWIHQTSMAGLFNANVYPLFNGSLWTLALEATCYMLLPFLAIAGGLGRRRWLTAVLWSVGLVWLAHDMGLLPLLGFKIRMFSILKVMMFFASGVLCYAFRDRIRLVGWLALVASLLLVVSATSKAAGLVVLVALPVVIFWLAVRLPFRNWERKADLSYGVYVYAFPVQQCLLSAWPTAHPLWIFSVALGVVLPVAFLSWFCVEKPSLRWKGALTQRPFSGTVVR